MLSHFFLNYHKKHPTLNGRIPESRVGWEERANLIANICQYHPIIVQLIWEK